MLKREKPYDVLTSQKLVEKIAEEEGYIDWGFPPDRISMAIMIVYLMQEVSELKYRLESLENNLKRENGFY